MATAQQNREIMPTVAKFVDEFRDVFGDDAKVVYAKENGVERGVKPEYKLSFNACSSTLPVIKINQALPRIQIEKGVKSAKAKAQAAKSQQLETLLNCGFINLEGG